MSDTPDDQPICDECGQPIAAIKHAPVQIEAGDCIVPEKEVRSNGVEFVVGIKVFRHD